MKKFTLLILTVFLAFTTKAEELPLNFTVTTSKAENNKYYFTLVASKPDTKVEIDWGNGTKVESEVLDMLYGTDVASNIPADLLSKEVTIKVYGQHIASITCSNKNLTGMAFSFPEEIKELIVGNNQLGNFDVSALSNLESFDLSSNNASNLNLSANTSLKKLILSSNTFASLDVSKNTNLTDLTLSSCGLESLDLTANVNLNSLIISNNTIDMIDLISKVSPTLSTLTAVNCGLTQIDLSRLTNLSSLNLGTNNLATIDLSKNTKLVTFLMGAPTVKSLDLSAATAIKSVTANGTASKRAALESIALPATGTAVDMSINVSYNQLSSIDISGLKVKTLNIAGNKFALSAIPNKQTAMGTTASRYVYHPQDAMAIPGEIMAGSVVDLSTETNLLGDKALDPGATGVATTFVWKKEDGTALTAGTDYTETEKGKFTFASSLIGEKVYCTLSSDAFPKLSGANEFVTTKTTIANPTSINEEKADATKVIGVNNGVLILHAPIHANVSFYSIAGTLIKSLSVNNDSEYVALPKGVYVVKTNNKATKVIVK